ncbi:MAG TPA: class I SAM-dependent methyltransferase [Candidatus Obscuribacterales bacterium]
MKKSKNHDYSMTVLSDEQIENGEYKYLLGGGADDWERRGAFQLELMRLLGLSKNNTLLDVGCGPLRAGIHFVRFLEPGNYKGVDYNESLIRAGRHVLRQNGFADHLSRLSVIEDFDFESLGEVFDFVLCFSVLNHCSREQQALFLKRVASVIDAGSRVIVTHGKFYQPEAFPDTQLRLVRSYHSDKDISPTLNIEEWFDSGKRNRFPILEFRLG